MDVIHTLLIKVIHIQLIKAIIHKLFITIKVIIHILEVIRK